MTDFPNPRRSIERLEPEQRRLCDQLLVLTPAQLVLPSNLPGWRVVDLAVHITRVCDSILLAVQRAIVGDQSPAFGAAAKPR
jgi:Mycothiol maleylpyruvate isomerase N-terminal domain